MSQNLLITEILGAGSSDDGEAAGVLVEIDGREVQLMMPYAVLEQFTKACVHASQIASEARFERGSIESATTTPASTPEPIFGFRYLVASGGEGVMLEVATSTGIRTLALSADQMPKFARETRNSAAMLAAPAGRSKS